ncbi:hypothetical protein GYMLUDRAFT_245637 [Collybiopsis luxurians FD-317 M1]|uniref:Uncharacterized protein n=1 Tax=Collybiopsis luxurians FD-317 M1 TaxID=944289 RepID=A0A0D0CK89_9AGAR|nr:hypothetical protein GYMLUDRAFT_245637 [Collybiopsis luxurians FD-317 M1]
MKYDIEMQHFKKAQAPQGNSVLVQSGEDEDDDDSLEYKHEAGKTNGRWLCCCINTALGWHMACLMVWEALNQDFFQNTTFSLHHICPPKHLYTNNKVTEFFNTTTHLDTHIDTGTLKMIMQNAGCGKAHAEVLLVTLLLLQSGSSEKIPQMSIGMCKKCCLLCWLLIQTLNSKKKALIGLSIGTHGTLFPWIVPKGLSEEICSEILMKLKMLESSLSGNHSHQSSGAASEFEYGKGIPTSVYAPDALSNAIAKHHRQR